MFVPLEALTIVRNFDKAHVDSATAGSIVRVFLDNIVDLFCHEKIWDVRGHAKCMIEWLRTMHVYRRANGEVHTIGGPLTHTRGLKQTCISRLKAESFSKKHMCYYVFKCRRHLTNLCSIKWL